ncbi:hypothetical protein ABPG75_007423 [Micractinium tetrahymenae]
MPSEAHGHEGGAGEEQLAALAIFTLAMLLVATLMIGHLLARRGVGWIGEAGVALLLGAAVGALVWAVPFIDVRGTFGSTVFFSKSFFLLAILPPIIFEAGWSMNVDRFFANCGAIACMAVAGTLISTAAIGLLVWAAGAAGLCTALPLLETLLFGSIISATDPVSVLAVFQRLGANQDLFALVLGESLLNDAVAMVLFRSLSTFLAVPATAGAVARAVALFIGVFVGSMALGAGVAFATAAIVRTRYFRSEHAPLESSLVTLFAWGSYMLADGLHLSGIVSILFCGLTAAHYVRPNMTQRGQDRVGSSFKLLASLAETSVFLFIGASLFLDPQGLDFSAATLLPFLLVCFVAMAASRAANVWPCLALTNYLRLPRDRVPQSHRFMLWWAGLRGAMAFAISLEAAEAVPEGRGRLMLSATYFVIAATVLANGGLCTHLLERLGLREEQKGAPLLSKHAQVELSPPGSPGAAIPAARIGEGDALLENAWQDTTATAAGPISLLPTLSPAAAGKPAGNVLTRSVQKLRQANSSGGMLSKLNKLDQRWLGPLFLAPGAQADAHGHHAAGDIDSTELAGLGSGAAGSTPAAASGQAGSANLNEVHRLLQP